MADFSEMERYGVLLAMAETAFVDIEDAVSLEFSQAMAAIFKVIPGRISFGLPPEDIHTEVVRVARLRGFDAYVHRLRERCEVQCGNVMGTD